MAIENFNDVKEYLTQNVENEEVKAYLNSFKVEPTLEVFKEKIKTDKEFKAFLDSEKDRHSSKSLETWKTNNLNTLIDDEVKKRFPEQDKKDIEIANLKAQFEQMQKESLRKDLTNKAIKLATDKKLPIELVDYLIGQDEESTIANIEKLESVFSSSVETLVEERLKTNSYTPPNNKDNSGNKASVNFMDIIKQNQAKR